MQEETYKVLLADAQFLIRFALKELLKETNTFQVIGEAGNEAELNSFIAKTPPDIIVIDYNQPGFFSIESIKNLKEQHPTIELLVISSDDNKENIYDVINSGVLRFLTKKCDAHEINEAFRAIIRGEKFFCASIFNFIFEMSFSQNNYSSNPLPLSARELEIVQLIAQGLVAKEIGKKLNLSTHTVYTHRKNIMEKLKLKRSSELVLFAVNKGLL
ncbi:MAG: response regulator transcription factor [Saprospiraceae bacterium]|nr:response regulator transcription factor [Saprospiraceae bacterium]